MCGITGFITTSNNYNPDLYSNKLISMMNSLNHRGPDSKNFIIDNESFLGLAHTRLSIQDLSINGNQPMESFSKKYMIIFNGEIYNHFELRKYIDAQSNNIIKWRGTSDTETLINAFEVLGIDKLLKNLKGMFAFAIWNKKNSELYLVRDSIGEKPLYYGNINNEFAFASEIKTLNYFFNSKLQIDMDALSAFMSLMYVPSPLSIYKYVNKLEPGYYLKVSKKNNIINLNKYKWFNLDKFRNKKLINNEFDLNENLNKFDNILTKAIESQLISDVPIGTFLSGGIDSSIITSIISKKLSKNISTFTIGFEEKIFDESKYAKEIANYLGTNHNELIINEKIALNEVPSILSNNDEPFADSSIIPTKILSRFTSEKIKVVLSGDGGDELFGGYNRYVLIDKISKIFFNIPSNLKNIIVKIILSIPNTGYDMINNNINKLFNLKKFEHIGDKIHKVGRKLINSKNLDELYINLLIEWDNDDNLFKDKTNSIKLNYLRNYTQFKTNDKIYNMSYFDTKTYLPDDILCKVDRSSMSYGLETRAPFLDLDVVKFAYNLPSSAKVQKNKNKIFLRKYLQMYLSNQLIDRPKMGFGIPIQGWLNGPLKEYTFDLLTSQNIKESNYFEIKTINKLLDEHYNKNRNWSFKIWALLTFESWSLK